jgi:glutaconate CoA-transferase subunit B
MALDPSFRGDDDGNGGALARMSAGSAAYTASELLAVMSARLLRDGQVVFAGVGIPLLAATLAQRLHAPGLTILFEGGVIGAFIEPGKLPPSTNEQRCTRRANMVLSSTDVLLLLQRGYVDIGFMGGAQIDQYGNLNSSFIGEPSGAIGRSATRLPGTGGGNDIASLTQMIVAMKHEQRRFVNRVDFVTSPGFLSGEESRHDAGLVTGGMYRVVTDFGVFGFDERSKRMQLQALHPGITADRVQESTGFELLVAPDLPVTDPPTEDELAALRHLDPDRLYTA